MSEGVVMRFVVAVAVFAIVGCAGGGARTRCSENPALYHVYEKGSGRVTTPGPTRLVHVDAEGREVDFRH